MRRVDAAHVQLWIGLKIAQSVGFGKDLLIGQAGVFHARQDVVARSVHHAHDAGDLIACKPFGQAP